MNVARNLSKFSWVFDGTGQSSKLIQDFVIAETNRFVVIPSLGSLVPGWLLIIPKRPMPNFSFLNAVEFEELEKLLETLFAKIAVFQGVPQLFEHGGPFGSAVSCGVDQAHLHVVPLEFDLNNLAIGDHSVEWKQVSGNIYKPKNLIEIGEYLFVSSAGKSAVGKLDSPTSQWFRKLIAKELGIPDEWNYKAHPKHDITQVTLDRIGA